MSRPFRIAPAGRGACQRLIRFDAEYGEAALGRGFTCFHPGEAGIRSVVAIPADAPKAKVEATRNYGADIRFFDRHKDDRDAFVQRHLHDPKSAWFKSIEDIAMRLRQKGFDLSAQFDLTATPPVRRHLQEAGSIRSACLA